MKKWELRKRRSWRRKQRRIVSARVRFLPAGDVVYISPTNGIMSWVNVFVFGNWDLVFAYLEVSVFWHIYIFFGRASWNIYLLVINRIWNIYLLVIYIYKNPKTPFFCLKKLHNSCNKYFNSFFLIKDLISSYQYNCDNRSKS